MKKKWLIIIVNIMLMSIFLLCILFHYPKVYITTKCLFNEKINNIELEHIFKISFFQPLLIQKSLFLFSENNINNISIHSSSIENIQINNTDYSWENIIILKKNVKVSTFNCNEINQYSLIKANKDHIWIIDLFNNNNFILNR